MIRTIVLSRAYQLSSASNEAAKAVDPANRLIWRHSPRRLEAEEIRDTMLFAAGRLDVFPLQGSPAKDMKVIELTDTGSDAKRLIEAANSSVHRSIYLPLLRGFAPHSL